MMVTRGISKVQGTRTVWPKLFLYSARKHKWYSDLAHVPSLYLLIQGLQLFLLTTSSVL